MNCNSIKENGIESKVKLPHDLLREQRIKDWRRFALVFLLCELMTILLLTNEQEVPKQQYPFESEAILLEIKNYAYPATDKYSEISIYSGREIIVSKAYLGQKVDSSDEYSSSNERWIVYLHKEDIPIIQKYLGKNLISYPFSPLKGVTKNESINEIIF